jgi:hypothetical protein
MLRCSPEWCCGLRCPCRPRLRQRLAA